MVPGRENYVDWKDVKGFGLVGDTSFFPHMDDRWHALVQEKTSDPNKIGTLHCLRDDEACCVEGNLRRSTVFSLCPKQ